MKNTNQKGESQMTNEQNETSIAIEDTGADWTNFETWVVYRSTQKDEESRNYWSESTLRKLQNAPHCLAVEHGSSSIEQAAKYTLALQLQNVITSAGPDLGNTLYEELLYSVLDTVNWLEIAEQMINELS
jgi:hypothetical protein